MFSTGKKLLALGDQLIRLGAQLRELQIQLDTLEEQVGKSTPAALGAHIDDLRGAIDAMRAGHRKEFGALWGRLGGKPANGEPIQTQRMQDGSFEALLDLQGRPPAGPGA